MTQPPPPPPPSEPPFALLYVCTGNICRSPIAERLTRAALASRLGPAASRVVVESAGTWGHAGAGMDPFALRALDRLGVDGRDFRARELTPALVERAHLVLTAQRQHRAAVVTLVPKASARTFTIREFSRLASALDPTTLPAYDVAVRGRALVAAATAMRGLVPGTPEDDDDIADPYGRSLKTFDECVVAIVRALRAPLDVLAPGPGSAAAFPTLGEKPT